MKQRSLALLALSLAAPLAHAAPQGFEWFPRTPGIGDPLHLLMRRPCNVQGIVATPHIRLLDAASGTWEINYRTGSEFCLGHVVSAVRIPDEIDGVALRWLEFRETRETGDGGSRRAEFPWTELTPEPAAIPPAISGTWFSVEQREQGLLVNMSETGQLVVGWTTYGADGHQRWLSGIAAPMLSSTSVTIALTDTGDGRFAGTLPDDAPSTPWGSLTLDYRGCGRLHVAWNPRAETGLQPGSADMQQLTPPRDAMCDLRAYAAAMASRLNVVDLIVDAPLPARD